MGETFHNYERKLQREQAAVDRAALSRENKRAIHDFADYCFSEGLSVPRVEKYVRHLRYLAGLLDKDFSAVLRGDLEKVLRTVQQSKYSEWTKHDLRVTLKKFYRWLRRTDKDPPETAWIRVGNPNSRPRLPEELLTEKDVAKLIGACHTRRDKAFVATLYESGCRIGEIASLRIKHVVPHQYGFRLIVSGKKGDRRVLIVSSAPYLSDWLNEHPCRPEKEAYLWVTRDRRTRRLAYGRLSGILQAAADRAHVDKKVNPHTFRHSRATQLAASLTEAQMSEVLGWVQGSDMPSVYVHLSGRDVDNALLKTYGITPDAKEASETSLKPRPCPRCGLQNAPTNSFCSRCGSVLDESVAGEIIQRDLERSQADGIMDRLVQDPEFRAMLERKLAELGKPKG